ncbi:MAG: hypothetical protein DRI65_06765 [Chloroflexota bacterium]|nr:MAG: hypothetical protein DRI65_06765 [Chloroflexota bacterium]HDD61852.1 hypothetical protein [Chloroflexota bacterium]
MEAPRLQIKEEILLAKQSRQEGNEGRARVCARRAAGAAVKEYLVKKGISQKQENAIQSLLIFSQSENLPVQVQEAVDWLVQRVNQDHNLPSEVDLIHEAGVVIQYVEENR